MCSRLKLLWNIDEKSIEEVLIVLARMGRIYLILSLLSLLYIYMAVEDDDLFDIGYECGILVLFVGYVCILRSVTAGVPPVSSPVVSVHNCNSELDHTARIPKLKVAGCIVLLISTAYAVKMIYYFMDDGNYVDLALSFISILIQVSTLYVLAKLINKITFASELLLAGPASTV
jgi:hypothetical protein